MRKTISLLLVVGVCAVGLSVAAPIPRGSPYSGKFVGQVPGTATLWPITIKSTGEISAEVLERPSRPLVTITWGSFSGSVDVDGLLQCTGVEFVRNSGGGVDTTPIDFKANVVLTPLGNIEGTTGTGEALVWLEKTTTTKAKK